MDLERLIDRAAHRDLDAFAEVVRRFQHMAFGSALALVRELPVAEDVVQEAFVAAWFALPTLAGPAAFPAWLRSIVRHRAHRVLRRRQLAAMPLAAADGVAADEAGPDRRAEDRRRVERVLAAIGELAPPLREVVTLFYVHECSQQDIATFLGLPVSTVNNRLHAARGQLKRRVLTMVSDTLKANQLGDDFATRIGRIVRARGAVVEARFDDTSLPDILTELTVSDESRRRAVTVQVVQILEGGVVRGVVTSPADDVLPGASVMSSGRRTESRVPTDIVDRTIPVLAGLCRAPGTGGELLETGIKVIDVLCPLTRDGTAAIAGELDAGPVVVTEELVRRISGDPGGMSLFTFVPPGPGLPFQEVWAKEGFSTGTVGSVQTFYFAGEHEWTAQSLSPLTGVDVVIRLSRALGKLGIWPAIDPLLSRSRLLDAGIVGEAHAETARRVCEALALLGPGGDAPAPPGQELAWQRARKLQRFFAQPFYVAEPYTRRPGVTVSRAEALRVCREILDGVHDQVPETAFYFTGGIEDVLERARAGTGG
jgi:RNA polymerase sigma factor (sigma-70 family)